jgi:hypothetical protein
MEICAGVGMDGWVEGSVESGIEICVDTGVDGWVEGSVELAIEVGVEAGVDGGVKGVLLGSGVDGAEGVEATVTVMAGVRASIDRSAFQA